MIVPIKIFNIIVPNTLVPTPYMDILNATPNLLIELGAQPFVSDPAILGAVVTQTHFYAPPVATYVGTLDNQPLTLSTNVQSVVGNSNLYTYIVYNIVNI